MIGLKQTLDPAGPVITCRTLSGAPAGDWDAVHGVFREAVPCAMRQAWRKRREARFRPATVRCARTADALWILAELDDEDMFNPVTQFNEPLFARGDAFEIFLRPLQQEAYYEFHVSPENQRFQLRFPGRNRMTAVTKVADFQIDSRTRVMPERGRWDVLAGIPFARVAEARPPRDGDRWLFSFSRYDYTRGQGEPVLSSTSPHRICNFHRMEEWGTLVFE
jgi:hypothetical protein